MVEQNSAKAGKWYGSALIIGIVLAVVHALLPSFSKAALGLGYLGLLATLIIVILGGRFARISGRRPSWFGMRLALIVAVPQIIGQMLTIPSKAAILKHLNTTSPTLPASLKDQVASMLHSPAGQIEGVVGNLIMYFIAGVLFGWIGSLFARNREAERREV